MSANSGSISPVIYLLFIFPLQYFSLSLNMPYLASEDGSPSFFKQFVNRSTYLFTFPYPFQISAADQPQVKSLLGLMEKLSQLLLNHRILTFYDFKKEHGDEYL